MFYNNNYYNQKFVSRICWVICVCIVYFVVAVNMYVLVMCCVIVDSSVHSCMINVLKLSGSVMVKVKVKWYF